MYCCLPAGTSPSQASSFAVHQIRTDKDNSVIPISADDESELYTLLLVNDIWNVVAGAAA